MVANILKVILFLALTLVLNSCQEPVQQVQVEEDLPLPEITFDLNTVTYDQLMTVDGINKRVARNIVSFRKKSSFRRVEDLLAVDGIGEKTFLWIRRYFHVSGKPGN